MAIGGDDKIIRIFNLSDMQQLDKIEFILKGHTKSILSMVIIPNKNFFLSGSRDRTIRLWDLRSGTTKQILKKHSNAVTCLSLN